jgi:ketosteroid isomerase-like protein
VRTNVETIQEAIEQIVNQKRIDRWDRYFAADYVARGAPFVGLGFSRDTSGNRHVVDRVFPGGPADGQLQAGDELLWVEDGTRRWASYEEIERGLRGRRVTLGVRRGDRELQRELTRDRFERPDAGTEQAKAEMREFMTHQFPDVRVTIRLIVAEGDMVVSLLEYRGTHARFGREAVWQEAWFARLSEGRIVEGWPVIETTALHEQLGDRRVPPGA